MSPFLSWGRAWAMYSCIFMIFARIRYFSCQLLRQPFSSTGIMLIHRVSTRAGWCWSGCGHFWNPIKGWLSWLCVILTKSWKGVLEYFHSTNEANFFDNHYIYWRTKDTEIKTEIWKVIKIMLKSLEIILASRNILCSPPIFKFHWFIRRKRQILSRSNWWFADYLIIHLMKRSES